MSRHSHSQQSVDRRVEAVQQVTGRGHSVDAAVRRGSPGGRLDRRRRASWYRRQTATTCCGLAVAEGRGASHWHHRAGGHIDLRIEESGRWLVVESVGGSWEALVA